MTELTTIDLLCRARFEMRDWQEALGGGREGLDELCQEIDAKIADKAKRDGYACPDTSCGHAIPHDSSFCSNCGFGPPGAP
jgi:hypothetical protein